MVNTPDSISFELYGMTDCASDTSWRGIIPVCEKVFVCLGTFILEALRVAGTCRFCTESGQLEPILFIFYGGKGGGFKLHSIV